MTIIKGRAARLQFPGIGFRKDGDIITFDSIQNLTAIADRLESEAAHVGIDIVDSAERRWCIAGIHRGEPTPGRRWWQFWRDAARPVEIDVELEEIEPIGLAAARERIVAHAAALFDTDDPALTRIRAATTMEELSDACVMAVVRTPNRRILRGDQDVKIGTTVEVARRAMILFAAVRISQKVDSLNILTWLDKHDLINAMSPDEAELFGTLRPSEELRAKAGWNIEGLTALLWALDRVDMPNIDEFADDISPMIDIIPPTAKISVREFMASAALRPARDIALMAETYWTRLSEARDAGESAHEAAYRRHAALQWILNPQDMGWE